MMNFNGRLDTLYDAALALLYPRACAVCGMASVEARADSPACSACWGATRVFTDAETLCSKCGVPAWSVVVAATATGEGPAEVRCRRCEEEEFTAARACGIYEGALRASVLNLKREPHVAARLARLMHETCLRAPFGAATRVVPVPLHPERERERGFNQASLLAGALSARSGITLDEWSLARVTHTEQHRAGMDARARRESVEAAFRVTSPRLVEGESILLVDDVFTTGATVSACAGALRAAGAREVFVITVARV
ncbi:MAG: ComF family protein [Acidobacteria bacterium]|nr:ComF family protein [Acidobacteriota bacterium]